MLFVNRKPELARLDRFVGGKEGGLAVVYGRRRVGKTRLLLEWAGRNEGLYTVADQSLPELQRTYFAEAIAQRLPGFADVHYPTWRALLSRLAREAKQAQWHGPLILDELPYLVLASPELPSVLQRFLDHEGRDADFRVAIAGSSQRMMQGLVLASDAPLYGRAREILELRPLAPRYLLEAFEIQKEAAERAVALYAAWGGIPRYWELAQEVGPNVIDQIERLVLDPLGPLHREPDRLLLEEIPSASEVRPLLEAIGSGAHRVSEIAGRLGRGATSMARPLDRLVGLGLVCREVPFGESEKSGKRALYKIDDPLCRLWFRVVAPHRAQLASGQREVRRALFSRFWDRLLAEAWEELCRHEVSSLGPWGPGARWWQGDAPEWDVVAESLDGERLLVGEVKWSARPATARDLERAHRDLAARPLPTPVIRAGKPVVRALFVPSVVKGALARPRGTAADAITITARDLLASAAAG